MLEEFRKEKITWDRANNTIYKDIVANSGDSNGRQLEVQVVNGGVVEPLNGHSLNLSWKTKNGEHYGLDAFEVVDLSKGLFRITYTTGMLSNTGALRSSFVLINSNGRLESQPFNLTVIKSNVDDGAVQSSNSFTTLTTVLVKVNDFDAQLAQKIDKNGNEQVTWGMLDQSTKENITGGNTAVVGVDSVNTSNVVRGAITPGKTNFLIEETNNEFDKSTVVDEKIFTDNGSLIDFPGFAVSDFIPVSPQDVLTLSNGRISFPVALYNGNKGFLNRMTGTAAGQPVAPWTFSPNNPNTAFIRVNINKSSTPVDDFVVVKGPSLASLKTVYKIPLLQVDETNLDIASPENRFKGKKILVSGDSITASHNYTTKLWHEYLKDWMGFGEIVNEAISGSGFVKNNGIAHRMGTTYNVSNLDYIAIMGNMNDGTNGSLANVNALGTFDDQSDDMKDQTIYGALHYICKTAIAMHPNIPIVFIISPPRGQIGDMGKCWGIDGWFNPWVDAIEDVCNHYSIPVFNLYHNSGLRPWDAESKVQFFDQNDGFGNVHPNARGHELMAQKIYAFMKQYM